MACKGTRVTQSEKRKMWELYQKLGCYKEVGRKCRRSPDTVSRYVLEYEAALQTMNYHNINKED